MYVSTEVDAKVVKVQRWLQTGMKQAPEAVGTDEHLQQPSDGTGPDAQLCLRFRYDLV